MQKDGFGKGQLHMKRRMVILLLTGVVMMQTVLLGACNAADDAEGQQSGQEAAQETAGGDSETADADMETAGRDAEAPGGDSKTDEPGGEKPEDKAAPDAGIRYEDGANGFAFRLTKEMLEETEKGENSVMSPYSVWLPLAALANGTDEEAKAELLSALGKSCMDVDALNEEVKNALSILKQEEQVVWMRENGMEEYESPLKIANALFVDRKFPVNGEFESNFTENYDGKLFEVDFADGSAVQIVNDWADEQTDGKIRQVIDSFDPQTVAAIANAIYYADGWAKKFPEENTRNDIFQGSAGEQEAPFMYHEFTEMPYYEDETMQAAALSTATGGRLTVLLPKEGQSAEELLAGMDADKFAKLMESGEATVQLFLPKFKVESGIFSVKEVLERMGIPLTDGENPHLDKVAEGELLYISQAVQKAMIEVDEEGMTAAAVTVMAMQRMSMPIEQEPVEMKCDRPFAFILSAYDGEGQQVLFTGVVNRIGE